MVQVHQEGVRTVWADKRTAEWKPPQKGQIKKAASNRKQLLVGLTGGLLYYFEWDRSDILDEIAHEVQPNDIAALAVGPIPTNGVRARFCAVALMDKTVVIKTLNPGQPDNFRNSK